MLLLLLQVWSKLEWFCECALSFWSNWLCSLGCRPNNGTHTLSIRSVNDDIELLISVSFCAVSSMFVSCCISVFDLFDESILVYFSVFFFYPTCTPFQC